MHYWDSSSKTNRDASAEVYNLDYGEILDKRSFLTKATVQWNHYGVVQNLHLSWQWETRQNLFNLGRSKAPEARGERSHAKVWSNLDYPQRKKSKTMVDYTRSNLPNKEDGSNLERGKTFLTLVDLKHRKHVENDPVQRFDQIWTILKERSPRPWAPLELSILCIIEIALPNEQGCIGWGLQPRLW